MRCQQAPATIRLTLRSTERCGNWCGKLREVQKKTPALRGRPGRYVRASMSILGRSHPPLAQVIVFGAPRFVTPLVSLVEHDHEDREGNPAAQPPVNPEAEERAHCRESDVHKHVFHDHLRLPVRMMTGPTSGRPTSADATRLGCISLRSPSSLNSACASTPPYLKKSAST